MENIDPKLKIQEFQYQIDIIIAELNQAKQEAHSIASFVARGDSKTYANVALIKSRSVLAYCVSANKRLQAAYENAKQVQEYLKQAEN